MKPSIDNIINLYQLIVVLYKVLSRSTGKDSKVEHAGAQRCGWKGVRSTLLTSTANRESSEAKERNLQRQAAKRQVSDFKLL